MRFAVLALSIACRTPDAPIAPQEVVDPLPSWNAGPSRDAIVAFVEAVTTPGPDFVEPDDRVAVFDNDGTLWIEQPNYVQALLSYDLVRAAAPEHPEWATEQPFAGILADDMEAVNAAGFEGYLRLTEATHGGRTTEGYAAAVATWLATARHPRFDRPYTELTYAPMRELLDYLRAEGFRTWIVSGGGEEFMRVFAEDVYGIPPEQVIGTRVAKSYEIRGGRPVIAQLPEVGTAIDTPGKVIAIEDAIGRRPIAAFGNSDGDRAMLEWTTAGEGRRLGALVHHTDAEREYAYDRGSPIGTLDDGLDQAARDGWVVIDMKTEWRRVFAFEGSER